MTLKPTTDRLLIKKIEPKITKKSVILMPEKVQKKGSFAEIIAVGPEVLDFKIGDKIVYGDYGFDPIQMETAGVDVDLLIGQEKDVLALMIEEEINIPSDGNSK